MALATECRGRPPTLRPSLSCSMAPSYLPGLDRMPWVIKGTDRLFTELPSAGTFTRRGAEIWRRRTNMEEGYGRLPPQRWPSRLWGVVVGGVRVWCGAFSQLVTAQPPVVSCDRSCLE